jgi:hypothetical protein
VWREERFWNAGVLQGVFIANLVIVTAVTIKTENKGKFHKWLKYYNSAACLTNLRTNPHFKLLYGRRCHKF